MKTIILCLLLSLSARAEDQPTWSPTRIALFDTCVAYYHWKEYAPACLGIIEQSKHHLVSEQDYNSYCGATMKFKADIDKASAEYKKLTKKKPDVRTCPEESKNQPF